VFCRSDLDETHAYVPSLPVLIKQLQALRHTDARLISAVERSWFTSTGEALAAFSVMLRVPAFTIGL
jgi:hypothetical protein